MTYQKLAEKQIAVDYWKGVKTGKNRNEFNTPVKDLDLMISALEEQRDEISDSLDLAELGLILK
jgi:hypothetical protein